MDRMEEGPPFGQKWNNQQPVQESYSLPQSNSRLLRALVKALEVVLLSAGLISTFVVVKGAVFPYSCEIVFSSLMGVWNSIKCFLSSNLYICIMINFMVVLIAASSTFHRPANGDQHDETVLALPPPPPSAAAPPPPAELPSRTEVSTISSNSSTEYQTGNLDDSSQIWLTSTEQYCGEKGTLFSASASFLNEAMIAESQEIKKPASSPNFSQDVSDSIKETMAKETEVFKWKEDEEANNLSDDKESEEDDTMDATWKAITGGGKQRAKKKRLKKSETWDVPPRRSVAVQRLDSEEVVPSSPKWRELRKSETFNDSVSMTRIGGLRRDPSMSLEEFNKQVEEFIKKFNHSMRLQRQESDQRFLDMIRRGL